MVTYLTFPVIAEALDTLMIIDQRPSFRQYDIHYVLNSIKMKNCTILIILV